MTEPLRPLVLIPGDERPARLGGGRADTEAQRDLGVQEMREDLDHGPLTGPGAASQPGGAGPTDHADDAARTGGERGEHRGAPEAVMGLPAHRTGSAGHCLLRRL